MATGRSDLKTILAVAQLLGIVAVVAALYFARSVFVPLALAILLAFLLSPVVNWLQRNGTSNIFAVLATATLTFLILIVGVLFVGRQLSMLLDELPQYKHELLTKVRNISGLRSGMGQDLGDLADEVSAAMEDTGEAPPPAQDGDDPADSATDDAASPIVDTTRDESASASSDQGGGWFDFLTTGDSTEIEHDGKSPQTPLYITPVRANTPSPIASWAGTVGTMLGPLGTAGLVLVLALFMLVHRDDLRDRMIKVVSHGNYVVTTEALDEVGRRISRYLVAQTVVNVSYGLSMALGLFLIGKWLAPDGHFPNYALWGVISATFRFVPYVGPVVGAIFPLLISVAVFSGYQVFIGVAVLITIMELISNNVLEPWLYGASTGLSAVAVIFAAVFWGWLWGPVGLLLSTPLTVCLVVLGRHVPRFKVFYTVLGDQVELNPALRFYQRLLVDDPHRSRVLLAEYVENQGAIAAFDRMVIPAIKRVHQDVDDDVLSPDEGSIIYQRAVAALEESEIAGSPLTTDSDQVEEKNPEADADETAEQPEASKPLVLGCDAHDRSEGLILGFLANSLREQCELVVIEPNVLPEHMAEEIARRIPQLAIIAVIPPGGFAQARFLCRSIRRKGYQGIILVACFGKFKHFDRLFMRFRKVGASYMTTSVEQTRTKILRLIQPQASLKRIPPYTSKGRPKFAGEETEADASQK